MRISQLIPSVMTLGACSMILTPASRAAITINSVDQGFSISANDGSGNPFQPFGSGSNGDLPLVNYNQSLTNGDAFAKITQTVTNYTGPTALGQAADSFTIQDVLTASISFYSSASTNLTINFTLDGGESCSYSSVTSNNAVQLLYQGKVSNTPVDVGTTFLGSGTYILQMQSQIFAPSVSVNLQINPSSAPEPASLSGLTLAAFFLKRRRRQ